MVSSFDVTHLRLRNVTWTSTVSVPPYSLLVTVGMYHG